MAFSLTLVLALAVSAAGDRTLLCRPRVDGDPALARAEAVTRAAASRASKLLDYGVPCQDTAEAARAARRAGLAHAVAAVAEGRADGSRYVLVLADAETEQERAKRALEVAPGLDAVKPIRTALDELLAALPPRPGPRPAHVAAWSLAGAGAAVLGVGAVFAFQARDAADRVEGAATPEAYTSALDELKGKRRNRNLALAAGGAALAAGLTWRFVF
jgi:hypothetical protein